MSSEFCGILDCELSPSPPKFCHDQAISNEPRANAGAFSSLSPIPFSFTFLICIACLARVIAGKSRTARSLVESDDLGLILFHGNLKVALHSFLRLRLTKI